MPKIALVGQDLAGGLIVGPGKPNWTWNGKPISVLGDAILPHGSGPHAGPKIVQGSSWMTIDGIPVTHTGDAASCGHTAVGTAPADIP